MHQLLDDLHQWEKTETAFSFGEYFHLTLKNEANPEDLHRFLESKGHQNIQIKPIEASIEDCFMALGGQQND